MENKCEKIDDDEIFSFIYTSLECLNCKMFTKSGHFIYTYIK